MIVFLFIAVFILWVLVASTLIDNVHSDYNPTRTKTIAIKEHNDKFSIYRLYACFPFYRWEKETYEAYTDLEDACMELERIKELNKKPKTIIKTKI